MRVGVNPNSSSKRKRCRQRGGNALENCWFHFQVGFGVKWWLFRKRFLKIIKCFVVAAFIVVQH